VNISGIAGLFHAARARRATTNKDQTKIKQINLALCRINYQMHMRCDMIAVLQMKRPAKAVAVALTGLTTTADRSNRYG
jgi:hypothetical protein